MYKHIKSKLCAYSVMIVKSKKTCHLAGARDKSLNDKAYLLASTTYFSYCSSDNTRLAVT